MSTNGEQQNPGNARTRRVVAVCALIACANAWPQEKKPDFSGRWVMDASRSSYGSMPLPRSYTEVIEHKEPALTIATTTSDDRGAQKYFTKFTTDDKDNLNEINGNEFHSKSHWEGGKLITTVTGDRGLRLVETRTLSADGKTQTVETFMGQAGPTPQMTRVMHKER